MIFESPDVTTPASIARVTQLLTLEERAGLKSIIDESGLDNNEALVVALSLCYGKVRLSAQLIHEARSIFRTTPTTRSSIVEKLGRSFKEDNRMHGFTVLVQRHLNDFCRRCVGEAVFRGEWVRELGGQPDQRLESGVADIVTGTHVYEVKDISRWRQALAQAIIYANELGSKPGLALFGPELEAGEMEILGLTASDVGVDVLLKVWKQDRRSYGEPKRRTTKRESSWVLGFLNRIKESELRKKEIAEEMDYIVRAFSLSGPRSRAIGCLRLEETHCTKDGRKYGPYGPYYYLYLHRTEKLEKRYLGKRADKFRVRRDAIVKLKRLEADYKRILKLERQMLRASYDKDL